MGELHLIDIRVRPGAYVKDVIDGCWRNLQEGVQKAGGKLLHCFKIIGENRIIAVIEDAAEAGAEAVTAAFGDHTELVCTPLRVYETFAEHVLGVENTLTVPSPCHIGSDGHIFWLHADIEYKGLSLTELLAVWKSEAQAILNLRMSGKVEMDLFKVVGQREVNIFMKVPSGEIMDDITFTLPIMKELGDQVHFTFKSLRHMTSSSNQP